MQNKNKKAGTELSLALVWPDRTLLNTSSHTPADQCTPLPYKKVRAFAARYQAPAESSAPVSALYSRSLDILQDYFQLILSDKYNLKPALYEVWTEMSDKGVFSMQYIMPESSMLPDDPEDYFDPDMEEAIMAFLDDLEECIGSENVIVHRESLAIEFASKMDLFISLYNYMSSHHHGISTPDRYGIDMGQFDPEILPQQLSHLLQREKNDAKLMIEKGELTTLVTVAPGDFYTSYDHFLARACMTMDVDIFIPLSQLLVFICQEDGLELPAYYTTPTTALYRFN